MVRSVAKQEPYRSLIQEFFRVFPDYPLCKSLAQNVLEGVCTRDHAEQLIYSKASGTAQNRKAIDEKLDARKVRIEGAWRPLRELAVETLCALPDADFRLAAGFYLKNPYQHGRMARPAWQRPGFTRKRFPRRLLEEARRRSMGDLAADLAALIDLA